MAIGEGLATICELLWDRDSDALHVQRFLNWNQKKDQTMDNFIMEVQTLAKHCPFDPIANKMVKFKIMCSLYNDHLQERLFCERNDRSLEKIIQICRVAEECYLQVKYHLPLNAFR